MIPDRLPAPGLPGPAGPPAAAGRSGIAEGDRSPGPSPKVKPVTKVRSEFPETWIWVDRLTGYKEFYVLI